MKQRVKKTKKKDGKSKPVTKKEEVKKEPAVTTPVKVADVPLASTIDVKFKMGLYQFVVSHFRDGVLDILSPLGQLVENSKEANATIVYIDLYENGDDRRIEVIDNGDGLDYDSLVAFTSVHHPDDRYRKSGIDTKGRNNSGTKFLFKYGDKFICITVHKNELDQIKSRELHIDHYKEAMQAGGDGIGKWKVEKRTSNLDKGLGFETHGTKIVIPNFRHGTRPSYDNIRKNLTDHLGDKYLELVTLRHFKNGKLVKSCKPEKRERKETIYKKKGFSKASGGAYEIDLFIPAVPRNGDCVKIGAHGPTCPAHKFFSQFPQILALIPKDPSFPKTIYQEPICGLLDFPVLNQQSLHFRNEFDWPKIKEKTVLGIGHVLKDHAKSAMKAYNKIRGNETSREGKRILNQLFSANTPDSWQSNLSIGGPAAIKKRQQYAPTGSIGTASPKSKIDKLLINHYPSYTGAVGKEELFTVGDERPEKCVEEFDWYIDDDEDQEIASIRRDDLSNGIRMHLTPKQSTRGGYKTLRVVERITKAELNSLGRKVRYEGSCRIYIHNPDEMYFKKGYIQVPPNKSVPLELMNVASASSGSVKWEHSHKDVEKRRSATLGTPSKIGHKRPFMASELGLYTIQVRDLDPKYPGVKATMYVDVCEMVEQEVEKNKYFEIRGLNIELNIDSISDSPTAFVDVPSSTPHVQLLPVLTCYLKAPELAAVKETDGKVREILYQIFLTYWKYFVAETNPDVTGVFQTLRREWLAANPVTKAKKSATTGKKTGPKKKSKK